MQERNSASVSSHDSSNQRKSVLPAVHANGRFRRGSLSPGACPISMTLLSTGPPDTTGLCILGQRLHASSAVTCRCSRLVVWIDEERTVVIGQIEPLHNCTQACGGAHGVTRPTCDGDANSPRSRDKT